MTAEAVYAPLESEKDFDTWKGKLQGKIVLGVPMPEVKASFEPLAKRYTEKDLECATEDMQGNLPPQATDAQKRDFLIGYVS